MTLKNVRPATMNSTRLLALGLFAIGIAAFAYLVADRGAVQRPPIASTAAWTGGFVLLALDERKRRAQQNEPKLPSPPVRRANHPRRKSPAPEYTHQTSHF